MERAENVLAFGMSGQGKTHCLAVLGRQLILRYEHSVWLTPTFKLVQQLLAAKAAFKLAPLLQRLDSHRVVILDDIGYVQGSREEMEVLFSILAERYERRSVIIINLVFSQWVQIFEDPLTTIAAVDRLVDHTRILEIDNPSIRASEARKRSAD